MLQNGAEDVKRHRWFKDYDWEDVYHRRLQVSLQKFRLQFHHVSNCGLHFMDMNTSLVFILAPDRT